MSLFFRICFVFLLFGWSHALQAQSDTMSIFVMAGCTRCQQTEEFAKKHKIPYKILTGNKHENRTYLADLLDAAGFKKGQLMFPVVVYKNKTSFNIPDMDAFLNGLIGKK